MLSPYIHLYRSILHAASPSSYQPDWMVISFQICKEISQRYFCYRFLELRRATTRKTIRAGFLSSKTFDYLPAERKSLTPIFCQYQVIFCSNQNCFEFFRYLEVGDIHRLCKVKIQSSVPSDFMDTSMSFTFFGKVCFASSLKLSGGPKQKVARPVKL